MNELPQASRRDYTVGIVVLPSAGMHIGASIKDALELARQYPEGEVYLNFNDTIVRVKPTDTPDHVGNRWNEDRTNYQRGKGII